MKILLILFLLNTAFFCLGQKNTDEDINQDKLLNEFNLKIDSCFESDFLLNNGELYVSVYQKVKGHPYFNANKWASGTLILESSVYPNMKLIYNLYESKIICYIKNNVNEELSLKINNNIITGFTIGEHVFINNKFINGVPTYGFYEIIYNNSHLNAYARWNKDFLNIYTRENMGEFGDQIRTLFIGTDSKYKEIKSKSDFLNCFGVNSKKIKTFMKKNAFKYKKMANSEFSKVFQFNENLQNSGN